MHIFTALCILARMAVQREQTKMVWEYFTGHPVRKIKEKKIWDTLGFCLTFPLLPWPLLITATNAGCTTILTGTHQWLHPWHPLVTVTTVHPLGSLSFQSLPRQERTCQVPNSTRYHL